jgi:DNA-binding MarR family transcriptional regulator
MADDLLRAVQNQAPEAGSAAAAIALLGHEPGMPIERLRRALGPSHPGAVRLIDRLEQYGVVERGESEQDRRAVALRLTAKGKKARDEILSARQKTLKKGFSGLTPSERKMFGQLAEKMLRALLQGEDHAYRMCRLCDENACADCPVEAALTVGAA